jgi:hypothetical protein
MHWTEAWLRSLWSGSDVVAAVVDDDTIQHDLVAEKAVMIGTTAVITTAIVIAFLKLMGTALQAYGEKISNITGG